MYTIILTTTKTHYGHLVNKLKKTPRFKNLIQSHNSQRNSPPPSTGIVWWFRTVRELSAFPWAYMERQRPEVKQQILPGVENLAWMGKSMKGVKAGRKAAHKGSRKREKGVWRRWRGLYTQVALWEM